MSDYCYKLRFLIIMHLIITTSNEAKIDIMKGFFVQWIHLL